MYQRLESKEKTEFLLWPSGLRIWHCCGCGKGHSCGLDSIPGLGTSICHGSGRRRRRGGGGGGGGEGEEEEENIAKFYLLGSVYQISDTAVPSDFHIKYQEEMQRKADGKIQAVPTLLEDQEEGPKSGGKG